MGQGLSFTGCQQQKHQTPIWVPKLGASVTLWVFLYSLYYLLVCFGLCGCFFFSLPHSKYQVSKAAWWTAAYGSWSPRQPSCLPALPQTDGPFRSRLLQTHAAKAKKAEINSMQFNRKKKKNSIQKRPSPIRTNESGSTTTGSRHQRTFLQGGPGLLPHHEGSIVAPCSSCFSSGSSTMPVPSPTSLLAHARRTARMVATPGRARWPRCQGPHPELFPAFSSPIPAPLWSLPQGAAHLPVTISPLPLHFPPLIPPSLPKLLWRCAAICFLQNIHKIRCIPPRWGFKSLFPLLYAS